MALRGLPLLLIGCGPLFQLDGDGDTDTDAPAETDGVDPDDDTSAPVPTYWGVDGALALLDGQVDPVNTALVLETRGETCVVPATVAAAQAVAEPDALLAWRLELTLDGDLGCRWLGPTTIVVGLGPTSPQLEPAAARAGWDSGRALGLYLRGEGPLHVVGLAATDGMRAGTEPVPTEAPTTGRWSLRTLAGLPVETP